MIKHVVLFILYGIIMASCNENLYAFVKNDKVGYINKRGKVKIPAIYDNCIFSHYYVDTPCLDEIFGAEDEYIPIKKNGKYGIINRKGKTILPFRYDKFEDQFDGIFIVQDALNIYDYYVIDINGDTILPHKFSSPFFIESNSLFIGEINGKGVIYDPNKKVVKSSLPFKYSSIFINGLASVSNDYNLWGMIDSSGQLVIDTIYKKIYQSYHDSLIVAKSENGYFIMNIYEEKLSDYYDRYSDYNSNNKNMRILSNGNNNYLFRDTEIIDSISGSMMQFENDTYLTGMDSTYFVYSIHKKKKLYRSINKIEFTNEYIIEHAGDSSHIHFIDILEDRISTKKTISYEGDLSGFYGYFPFLVSGNDEKGTWFKWVNKNLIEINSFRLDY